MKCMKLKCLLISPKALLGHLLWGTLKIMGPFNLEDLSLWGLLLEFVEWGAIRKGGREISCTKSPFCASTFRHFASVIIFTLYKNHGKVSIINLFPRERNRGSEKFSSLSLKKQEHNVVKAQSQEPDGLVLTWLCHFLAVWHWTMCLTALCLGFYSGKWRKWQLTSTLRVLMKTRLIYTK